MSDIMEMVAAYGACKSAITAAVMSGASNEEVAMLEAKATRYWKDIQDDYLHAWTRLTMAEAKLWAMSGDDEVQQ